MQTTPAAHRRTFAALAAALIASSLAWPAIASARPFSINSIIIPAQVEYQPGDTNSDGTIAAYGLVYTVLAKNEERIAAGKPPIVIHWVVEPGKLSHHRCATHTNAQPNYEGYNDNDGCDFAVINDPGGFPVAELDRNFQENQGFNARKLKYDNGVLTTSGTFPIDKSKTVVKYSGGAWIIDATQRGWFEDLLKNDPQLAHFHKNGPGRHYVALHSARVGFSGHVQRSMHEKPPLLAIVGKGTANILQDYLTQAGLDVVFGAELGGTPTVHGKVYDVLDPLSDFVATQTYPCGALNMPAYDNITPQQLCDDTEVRPELKLKTFYRVLWGADWKIDAASTYPPEWSGKELEASAKANALANIGAFVDRGSGLFAEDSSIVTFEGIATGATAQCTTMKTCVGGPEPMPFECSADFTPSRCDDGATCYKCENGYELDDSTCPGRCVPNDACIEPYDLVNGACYDCPEGEHLDTNNSNAFVCVPDGACPSGYTQAVGGCYACPKIKGVQYELDAQVGDVVCHAPCDAGSGQTWSTAVNGCVLNGVVQANTETAPADIPKAFKAPSQLPAVGTLAPLRAAPLPCPDGTTLSCGGSSGQVEGGSEATRFHTTGGVRVNSISGTFSGADCNDYGLPSTAFFYVSPGGGHDCVDYHADSQVPALLFSQKGNFNFTAQTGGNVQDFVGDYRSGTWHLVGSARVDASGRMYRSGDNAGFDFATMRHKDGDSSKGLVVYLSGHQYKFDFWGLRIILNTLLNLGIDGGDTELARSEPVGYILNGHTPQTTDDEPLVFQGTYRELPPPDFGEWREYSAVAPEAWRFPYTKGHLRVYPAGAIDTGGQDFVANQKFDAASALPPPDSRKIFTMLNGTVHEKWTKVWFDHTQTKTATCTKQAGVDAECDLVEKLAEGNTAGVTMQTVKDGAVSDTLRGLLGMFVQQVRGFCAAFTSTGVPIPEPSDGECKDLIAQKNVASLGGIDHSSPAVVGPSPLVTGHANRPVVAYAGGRDGMLHAFYIDGGAGYGGLPEGVRQGQELWAFIPPGQIPRLATNNAMVDAAINVIDVFADFPADVDRSGTVNWANTDEKPDGIREWRTVLLAAAGQESKIFAAGQGGLELFALDVTDPTNPVLLWHVTGIRENDDRWDGTDRLFARDATTKAITEMFDPVEPRSYAVRWQDWDDGDTTTPHIPAKYDETVSDNLKRYRTSRYDYSNLGFTYGTSIGKVWTGTAYQYVVYIQTTGADFKKSPPASAAGIDVFAIDLVTGQKLWQWQKRYSVRRGTTIIAGNDIPGRPALADVDSDGSVDRVYVGDLEGRIWELSALDGRNLIYWPVKGDTKRISLPLFGTPRMTASGPPAASDDLKALFTSADGMAQQPLTSPIGLGRFTESTEALQPYLPGRLAIVQGSLGVNWSVAPYEKGSVFVLPIYPEPGTRIALPVEGLDLSTLVGARDPTVFGVLERKTDGSPGAFWQIDLGVGERVYGMPRVVNNKVVFDTAFGDFTGDQLSATAFERGNLLVVSKDEKKSTPVHAKSFAGVLILGQNVIVTSATGIMRFDSTDQGISEGGFATRPFNRNTPAVMKTWELQGELVAPDLR